MVRFLLHWLVPALLLIGNAQAQPASRAAKPDPLNARAAVPALVHSSAFAAYRGHVEAVPIGWKEANDTVARIGGWRAYAREAAEPSPVAPSAPAAAASGIKP